jgi:hypothetical protein
MSNAYKKRLAPIKKNQNNSLKLAEKIKKIKIKIK